MIDKQISDQVLNTMKTAMEQERIRAGLAAGQPLQEQLFFKYHFKPENILAGAHGSLVQINHKILNLHDKKVRVSYLQPFVSLKSEDLKELLQSLSNRDLITMIRSDKTDELEAMGFEAVVEQQVCNIPSSSLPEFNVQGIVLDPPVEGLKSVFDTYTQYFTGYFERDLEDFEALQRDMQFLKGKIVGFMRDDVLVGYIRVVQHANFVEVLECCYDKSGTLLRLLSFVSRGTSRIIYRTNGSEKIHKLLPEIKVHNETVMMARINDKTLFEQLFHIRIISSYSAFNAFSKPVLNTDIF